MAMERDIFNGRKSKKNVSVTSIIMIIVVTMC